MNNEEQLKRLKELKKSKSEILHKIDKDNISLLETNSNLKTLLESLKKINSEQNEIWKERHKVRRLKYDRSERGRELSRIRSLKNYHKKKKLKLAD